MTYKAYKSVPNILGHPVHLDAQSLMIIAFAPNCRLDE